MIHFKIEDCSSMAKLFLKRFILNIKLDLMHVGYVI